MIGYITGSACDPEQRMFDKQVNAAMAASGGSRGARNVPAVGSALKQCRSHVLYTRIGVGFGTLLLGFLLLRRR
jgi:hypothetical protein